MCRSRIKVAEEGVLEEVQAEVHTVAEAEEQAGEQAEELGMERWCVAEGCSPTLLI